VRGVGGRAEESLFLLCRGEAKAERARFRRVKCSAARPMTALEASSIGCVERTDRVSAQKTLARHGPRRGRLGARSSLRPPLFKLYSNASRIALTR
jgi:hypothetical protein